MSDNDFVVDQFVVYPSHGVGKITAIEEQEIAGYWKDKIQVLKNSDLDGVRKLDNLALFFDPKYLSRILFFNHIYQNILEKLNLFFFFYN